MSGGVHTRVRVQERLAAAVGLTRPLGPELSRSLLSVGRAKHSRHRRTSVRATVLSAVTAGAPGAGPAAPPACMPAGKAGGAVRQRPGLCLLGQGQAGASVASPAWLCVAVVVRSVPLLLQAGSLLLCLQAPSRPPRAASRRVCWCLFSRLLARIDMIVGPPPPSTPRHKKHPTKGPTAPPRESPQYSPRSGCRCPRLCLCDGQPPPLQPHDGGPRDSSSRAGAASRQGQAASRDTLCDILVGGAPWAKAEASTARTGVIQAPEGPSGPQTTGPSSGARRPPAPATPGSTWVPLLLSHLPLWIRGRGAGAP